MTSARALAGYCDQRRATTRLGFKSYERAGARTLPYLLLQIMLGVLDQLGNVQLV